jgi:hypothetical protein
MSMELQKESFKASYAALRWLADRCFKNQPINLFNTGTFFNG